MTSPPAQGITAAHATADHLDRMISGWSRRAAGYLRVALPAGGTLTDADRLQRHRAIVTLLWLHSVALFAFGVWMGNDPIHSLTEAASILPWALLASWSRIQVRMRAVAACIGLLMASAVIVHFANGAIEAH